MRLVSLKQKRQAKIGLIVAGLILVLLLFYFVIYLPQREQIIALQLNCAEEKLQIVQIENFMDLHPDLSRYAKEVQARELLATKKMPETADFGEFIAQIEREARHSQIVLAKIQPEQMIIQSDFVEIPIQLEFQGDYFKIVDFLQNLEQTERFNLVQNLIIQAKNGSLSCQMKLKIYAYGIF